MNIKRLCSCRMCDCVSIQTQLGSCQTQVQSTIASTRQHPKCIGSLHRINTLNRCTLSLLMYENSTAQHPFRSKIAHVLPSKCLIPAGIFQPSNSRAMLLQIILYYKIDESSVESGSACIIGVARGYEVSVEKCSKSCSTAQKCAILALSRTFTPREVAFSRDN